MDEEVPFVYQVVNSEGTWVQLDKNSVVEFCESDEGEAWSLARDRGGNQYLRNDEGKYYYNVQLNVIRATSWCRILKHNVIQLCLLEQTLLEHGAQTPPPSPFSVQAFNRATTSNGAQGFDYGISNNKGEVHRSTF